MDKNKRDKNYRLTAEYTCRDCGRKFIVAQGSRREYCAECIVARLSRKPYSGKAGEAEKEVKQKEEE